MSSDKTFSFFRRKKNFTKRKNVKEIDKERIEADKEKKMWVAEFKVWHKNSPMLEVSEDFVGKMFNFNLNLFKEKDTLYIFRCALFSGNDAKEFRQEWEKKDHRIRVVARDSNQLFYYHEADEAFHSLLFDKTIFFIGPVINHRGYQFWKVGAPRKKDLLALFQRVKKLGKKNAAIQLLSLKQEELNIFAQSLGAAITPLQLKALQCATENGYYDYPRKVSLEELAEKSGIPRTTFQSHLRRAERKIIPTLVEKMSK